MYRTDRNCRLFLSIGHGLTQEREGFVNDIRALLDKHSTGTVTLGRETQDTADPLDTIRAMIRESDGTLVIAVERWRVPQAVEHPNTMDRQVIGPFSLPTVWNQVEAAITYGIGHPLLILREDELREEGIIDNYIFGRMSDPNANKLITLPAKSFTLPPSDGTMRAILDWLDVVKAMTVG